MDKSDVVRIVASDMTVSDKIRRLDEAGYPRADIARALGKRYQHVRNVLEGDRVGRDAAPIRDLAESGRRFEGASPERDVEDRGRGAYRLVVHEDGSVVLPSAVREAFGIAGRGVVMAKLKGDAFELVSVTTALRRIDEMLAPYRKEGVSWADELIAERRREQLREDGDG